MKKKKNRKSLIIFRPLLTSWFGDLSCIFRPFRWIEPIKNNVKVTEDDKNVYVEIEVPGFEKKEISIEVDERSLYLYVEANKNVKEENKVEKRTFKFCEYLPCYANISISPKASYVNGILKITLTKDKETKTNLKIEIE